MARGPEWGPKMGHIWDPYFEPLSTYLTAGGAICSYTPQKGVPKWTPKWVIFGTPFWALAAGPVLGASLYSVKTAQILVLGPWPGAQNGVPKWVIFGTPILSPYRHTLLLVGLFAHIPLKKGSQNGPQNGSKLTQNGSYLGPLF